MAGFLTQSPWSLYRKTFPVFSSVAVHLLLLVLLASFRNTPLPLTNEAGKTGNEISVVNLNQPMLPVATPVLSSPEEQVVLPKTVVVDKADIVVERKNVTSQKPPVTKATTVDNQPARPRPVVKPILLPASPDKHQQTELAQQTTLSSSSSAPVNAGSGGNVAAGGESTSGHAAKGAGNETTTRVRALNRRVNYPARARSMGVEGRVKVQFDISASGTIKNIQILAEDPAGVFSSDLRRDITRWRYDITGEVKNQIVTVIYKLDGRIQVIN
ncbi:TonB family protein [Pantoea sp. AS-PWVM4]|uniref:TonB family protein n=1 Tax=Pantoea sp. AS-PWVM4 TaxID=1332069 RepID=UPI001F275A7A|nr:TonB family protein [Pantoea sp. AS-PWVM4]